jgi:hypothetical protein
MNLLDKINSFRRRKLFLTKKEIAVAMMVHRAAVQEDLGKQRDAFKGAIEQLVSAKLSQRKTIYTMEFKVDAAALDTYANYVLAASAIGACLAEKIIERHKKQKQNDSQTKP